MFAGLRCMIDGSDDIISHNPDGSLNGFSWFWGFLCGFCRINPGENERGVNGRASKTAPHTLPRQKPLLLN